MSERNNVETPESGRGSHFQPSTPAVIVILLVFVLCAFVALRSPSSSNGTLSTIAASSSGSSSGPTTTGVVTKAQVRVQVANGTKVAGLARTYTQSLMTQGWDTLPEMNGPSVTKTVVYYNPGFKWAAVEIATSINVSQSSVTALGGLSPVAGASGDDVIVILGPDAPTTAG